MAHKLDMLQTWNGEALQATSINASVCPGCGDLILTMFAEDGTMFACGHLRREYMEQLVVFTVEAIKEYDATHRKPGESEH